MSDNPTEQDLELPPMPANAPEGTIRVEGDDPHHYFATSDIGFHTDDDLERIIADMKKDRKNFIVWFVPKSKFSDYKIISRAPQVLGAHTLSRWVLAEPVSDDPLVAALEPDVWTNEPY